MINLIWLTFWGAAEVFYVSCDLGSALLCNCIYYSARGCYAVLRTDYEKKIFMRQCLVAVNINRMVHNLRSADVRDRFLC